MAAFLTDQSQHVKIGDVYSTTGYPYGGVSHGTVSGPESFLVPITDLRTPCPLYKYADDDTLFDSCTSSSTSGLQDSLHGPIKRKPKKEKKIIK